MSYNADSKVKIPALVHVMRFDQNFISIKKREGLFSDSETNGSSSTLCDGSSRINSTELTTADASKIIGEPKSSNESCENGGVSR